MKHKLSVVIVLALMISLQSAAQEKKVLGLNEAIDLSVKNSKQLKRDQARIDEATAALREATDKRLPDAGLSGSYLRFNSPNIVMDTKSTGGGSGISADRPKINQFMYGIASFSLPIYSGGQIKYGINSAEYLQKAVALDADNEREEVVQTTIEAFANLFKATTAVRLMKENLAQSQQRVKELTNLEKNGLLARNDLLKAELQSSNIELSLLDAENNRRIANVNMNLMLGISTKTELVLDTAGVVKKQDDRVLDDYLNAAVQNRKDIAAYENRKKAAESGIRILKGEMYPELKLTGGYIAAKIPGFFSVTNMLNVGVGVNYNISSFWKTKTKIRQAEAQMKQVTLSESILDDNIQMDINRNYYSLVSFRKKIEVYEKASEQANENYRIVKNKFDNSLATTTELLEADVSKLQAVLSYTLARADAFVAYHKLLQSTGTLSTEFLK